MAESTCSVDECEAPSKARGLCWKHYKRLQRAGAVVPTPLLERLRRDIRLSADGCWEWTGERSITGYGRVTVGSRKHTVHRLVYELLIKPVPGLQLDHLCHTRDLSCKGGIDCPHRLCCNPDHLEPVTPRENWKRGRSPSALNARRETCKHGHPFDRFTSEGYRRCGTCANERSRRWRAKKGPQ